MLKGCFPYICDVMTTEIKQLLIADNGQRLKELDGPIVAQLMCFEEIATAVRQITNWLSDAAATSLLAGGLNLEDIGDTAAKFFTGESVQSSIQILDAKSRPSVDEICVGNLMIMLAFRDSGFASDDSGCSAADFRLAARRYVDRFLNPCQRIAFNSGAFNHAISTISEKGCGQKVSELLRALVDGTGITVIFGFSIHACTNLQRTPLQKKLQN